MPKKQALTVAELKALLLARFNAEKGRRAELQVRIQQRLGRGVQEENPEIVAHEYKLADIISDVLACRLKQSRRATSLLLFQDIAHLASSVINEITKAEGDKLEDEERKMFERFMKTMFENIFEMMWTTVSPRKNIYEEYWRWVTTVLDLATEHGILPTELLALQGATDEITRRMFTKKQFTALSKRAVSKFADIDTLRKIVVQPILDMVVAESDEEERREIERELEAQVMPQLREDIEKTRVIVNTFLSEEIKRIYAVA